MADADFEDVEEKLQELNQEISRLSERCHYRTMLRVANEARRLGRMERHLMPYMTASFHVMNDSRNVLQPTIGREVAIELITLLESEDRARQFQPNLPEEDYERTRWWLTACAYDNLAVNTAESNGYNSDGMHQCITDGIQVCRRTGKLQCISCFREYATDVYIAADDLDMALHHARVGINNIDPGPHDRRHVGARDSVRILMLQGHLEAALEALDVAWKLCDVFHSPYVGKLDTYTRAVELFYMAGCPERVKELPRLLSAEEGEGYDGPEDAVLIEPPRDEYPSYFLDRDLTDAFVECCRGEFDAATALIQPWDVLLREQKCLTRWFEVRLRLIAIARMTGKQQRAQALAKPLQEAAQESRDWHLQRRIERILDESVTPTPLALASPVFIGPFAEKVAATKSVSEQSPDPATDGAESSLDGEVTEESESPFAPTIRELVAALMRSEGDHEQVSSMATAILAIPPETVKDPRDAGRLLHLARFVSMVPQVAPDIWGWANSISHQHPQNASILSMLAALGATLRASADGSLDASIPDERLEDLFRQSMDLDPHDGENFARAGIFHLEQENYGEAERCLARGFRLLRTSGHLALKLAEAYLRTDRPRDAVAVLDMALREGCQDADVAWEAAISANHIEQYEAVLTYLAKFDELRPDEPWSNYYRACALLELQRPQEAMQALERESELNPEMTYHVRVMRVSCLAEQRLIDEFRAELAELLAAPIADVTYLTSNGLQKMFTRLWKSAANCLAHGDVALEQLETRLLETGLAPNELFAAHREFRRKGDAQTNSGGLVNFYRCVLRQPLDDRWQTFSGRLHGEESWVAYVIPWGVLAQDATEARRLVLEFQQRCYPVPAEILEIEEDGSDFTDEAGVVWQGFREGETAADDENE